MPTFLVFPSSDVDQEETFIVEASDEAEARSKSLELYSENKYFREYVESFSMNRGFIEVFLEDESGNFYEEFFDYRIDLYKKFEKDEQKIEAYIEQMIEKNVRAFFQDRPDLAALYLYEYQNSPFAASEFPSEMYSYILEKTNFSYFDEILVYPIELREKQSS
jgi:hypothetical protein